jgi:hypothetical protein
LSGSAARRSEAHSAAIQFLHIFYASTMFAASQVLASSDILIGVAIMNVTRSTPTTSSSKITPTSHVPATELPKVLRIFSNVREFEEHLEGRRLK